MKCKEHQDFWLLHLIYQDSLDDLKEKLKEIVDKAFKGGHNKYIQITSKIARWFQSRVGASTQILSMCTNTLLSMSTSMSTSTEKMYEYEYFSTSTSTSTSYPKY